MPDMTQYLAGLRRPRLLISAARFGLDSYRRDACLRRLLGVSAPVAPATALAALCDQEAELEAQRSAGRAGYSVARHVEVMIAMMAESRLDHPAQDSPRTHAERRSRDRGVSGTGTGQTQVAAAQGQFRRGANAAGG